MSVTSVPVFPSRTSIKKSQSSPVALLAPFVFLFLLGWPIVGLILSLYCLAEDTPPPLGFSKRQIWGAFFASWISGVALILIRLQWETLSWEWVALYATPYLAGIVGWAIFFLLVVGFFSRAGTEESG